MKVPSRTITAISFGLVCASVAANAALALPNAVAIFPLFFFIHIAIVGLGIWVLLRIRKLKSSWTDVFGAFRPIPKWLMLTGVMVATVAVLSSRGITIDLGTLPDGTSIHSKNWHMDDEKYWLSLNRQPAVEISKTEYEALQRESYAAFAIGWLVFSYLILVQWYYVHRRETEVANTA